MPVPDLSRVRSWRLGWLVPLCAIVALLVAMAAPSRADASPVRCPGVFRVLHDDRVGGLSLPRGNYRITLFAGAPFNCAGASEFFTRFLEDYDGKLLGGFRVVVATSTFVLAGSAGFHVTRIGGLGGRGSGGSEGGDGGGRSPSKGSFCPGTFRVLHRDRIGPLQLNAGPYWIVLLQSRGLSCAQASTRLGGFLDATSGRLPSAWILTPESASFRRSIGAPGFRIKPVR